MSTFLSDIADYSVYIKLTEFGYQREEAKLDIASACMKSFLLQGAHSMRMMGSGVLDLCFVGCGRLDAVYAGVAGMFATVAGHYNACLLA